jgi:hypothetical protein
MKGEKSSKGKTRSPKHLPARSRSRLREAPASAGVGRSAKAGEIRNKHECPKYQYLKEEMVFLLKLEFDEFIKSQFPIFVIPAKAGIQ